MFVAFVVLNGFALVFAAASLCAVAFGPLLLIWRGSASWRQQVVKVGLFHLFFSLMSLLAAFAAAGFIVAGVWAPDPNCAKVLCSEGGVSCSAFSYQSLFQLENVGGRTVAAAPYLRRTLSPAVVKLNNASFTVGSDAEVTCQDYTYIANYSRIAELDPKRVVGGQDASHGPVNSSCLILLSESVFGNLTSANTYVDPNTGTSAPKPNPYALWCTRDRIPTGLGWLPVKLQRAAELAQQDLTGPTPVTSSEGYTINSTATCPDWHVFSRADTFLNDSVPAFQLLKGVDNPLHEGGTDPTYVSFSESTGGDTSVNHTLQSAVCHYALLMGWDARGALSCPNTSSGIRYAFHPDPQDRTWPLGAAVYYPSLKYQCSGLVDGYLCAYGTDPQSDAAYAVDEDGNYLKRRQASDRGSIYVHLGKNPTETQVEGAVVAMITVALVAMLGTLALLGCLPYTGPSATLRRLSGLCV